MIEAALCDRDGEVALTGGVELGACIVKDYPPVLGKSSAEVRSLDAGTFLSRLVTEGSFVRIKLNCEGAEIAILESMLKNNLGWMLSHSLNSP